MKPCSHVLVVKFLQKKKKCTCSKTYTFVSCYTEREQQMSQEDQHLWEASYLLWTCSLSLSSCTVQATLIWFKNLFSCLVVAIL